MSTLTFAETASWIWEPEPARTFNRFLCFRRKFEVRGALRSSRLRITADARYEVFLNGEWLGHGPIRSWPDPWSVDEYDLRGRLRPGINVLTALVQDIGTGTFQYLREAPGLLAQVEWDAGAGTQALVTDASWRCQAHTGFLWPVPRISVQQAWEEQYDARKTLTDSAGRDWRLPAFDDAAWLPAAAVRPAGQPPHAHFELRDIPFLTRDPVMPTRVVAVEAVRTCPVYWNFYLTPVFAPENLTSNPSSARLFLATRIHSPVAQSVRFHRFDFYGAIEWKLNGESLAFEDAGALPSQNPGAHARLEAGWNSLLGKLPEMTHLQQYGLACFAEQPVRFAARAAADGAGADVPWLALGPFEPPVGRRTPQDFGQYWMPAPFIVPSRFAPGAGVARFDEIWAAGQATEELLQEPLALPVPPDCLCRTHVAHLGMLETVLPDPVRAEDTDALLFMNAEWSVFHPIPGADVRILLDFGRELVGMTEFEVEAAAGTILDLHQFEFIQRDGRRNLAEGMANSCRYVCRAGMQRYRTFVRRGFRYAWLSLRDMTGPVRLRYVRVLESIYPAPRTGAFACADARLDQIWTLGVESVRCCSEDSYTDCPTYEQTGWVGDARNEALVDLVAHGDPRLSRRMWLTAARSLDRSPLVESHVPSAWENVLPAWSFLWMRWAQEHFLLTGDAAFAAQAMPFLERNIDGIRKHLNRDGLFDIEAWNMFDWAPMDTPNAGVVTHQNCLAVLGLRQAAELAQATGHETQHFAWTQLADALSDAVNRCLWDDKARAYIDSIHADGKRSTVFSQQTQTAAYIAGVAAGERSRRCLKLMQEPPEGFVRAGSPFFMFFLLEGLVREQHYDELIKTMRDYWGVQVEAGATTVWECYYPDAARKTRSHCHGWSAAPTYFLSTYVLGVQAMAPGFGRVRLAPRGNLRWCHGRVPTPRGVIECHWERRPGEFSLEAWLPAGMPVEVDLPVTGQWKAEAGLAELLPPGPGGTLRLGMSGNHLRVSVTG